VSDTNIHRPEWDQVLKDPPFRTRAMRLGPRSGASEIGASLYEIDPGGAIAPYHIHHGNEELLLVLSGTPQLRTPDGVRTLASILQQGGRPDRGWGAGTSGQAGIFELVEGLNPSSGGSP
jgi:uncharacterized cupin superfamily protein